MDIRAKRVNSLIRKIQKGDEAAVDCLYAEFGALFLNMAKKYLFDKAAAEDLISETFLELYRNRARSFNPNFNGLNWIFTIIRKKAYRYNGRNGTEASLEELEEARLLERFLVSEGESDNALDALVLREALRTLSEYENQLLYYRYWEGLTIREIAKAQSKPRSSVHYAIVRILNKLKTLLEDEGYEN